MDKTTDERIETNKLIKLTDSTYKDIKIGDIVTTSSQESQYIVLGLSYKNVADKIEPELRLYVRKTNDICTYPDNPSKIFHYYYPKTISNWKSVLKK